MMRLQCGIGIEKTTIDAKALEPEPKDLLSSAIKPILMAMAYDCQIVSWEDSSYIYREVMLPHGLEDRTEIDISIQDGHIFIRQSRANPSA